MDLKELRKAASAIYLETPAEVAAHVSGLLNKAADEIARQEREIELLRDVHWQARTVFRYDGVDKERTEQAVTALREATYSVNDFDQNCEND